MRKGFLITVLGFGVLFAGYTTPAWALHSDEVAEVCSEQYEDAAEEYAEEHDGAQMAEDDDDFLQQVYENGGCE